MLREVNIWMLGSGLFGWLEARVYGRREYNMVIVGDIRIGKTGDAKHKVVRFSSDLNLYVACIMNKPSRLHTGIL